jgi:hypothetical protein
MSIWDEPEFRDGGEYVKFENVGDTITGTIVAIRAMTWEDGTKSPQIILDCDGTERTVTAGQVRLKAALAEKRPEAGDVISITFTSLEKRSGGKTLKHFDVVVAGAAPKATPTAAPSSTHSKEQLEAMKLLGIEPQAS